MTLSTGIAGELVLVMCDLKRHRLPVRQTLAPAVQGGVLAELVLTGLLTDERGRPVAVPGRSAGDPALDRVYHAIAASRPHRWRYWVRRDRGRTLDQVLDQLDAAGLLRVQRRRVFGILRHTTSQVLRPEVIRELRERVLAAATGATPVEEVSDRDAVLVALCDAGSLLGRVVPRHQRRTNRHRIRVFGDRAGAVVPAVRQVIEAVRRVAAMAGATGAMGGGAAAAGG